MIPFFLLTGEELTASATCLFVKLYRRTSLRTSDTSVVLTQRPRASPGANGMAYAAGFGT